MTRWLVTGGCGFIGRNLISCLLARPDTLVRVVDDLSVGRREELAAIHAFGEHPTGDFAWRSDRRLGLVIGDICDEALARRVADGADVVVHLAANTGVAPSVADPRRDCLNNVVGTLNYLEACRHGGIRRFVFASSGAPIGDCEPPLHEELPAHPVSPYGASKLAGEAYCSAFKHSYGVDTVALRFGNCYGPLSTHKSSIVAKFIREALAGAPWEIFGGGEQTRDFIFVGDVVDAICLPRRPKGWAARSFRSRRTPRRRCSNLLIDWPRCSACAASRRLRYAMPHPGSGTSSAIIPIQAKRERGSAGRLALHWKTAWTVPRFGSWRTSAREFRDRWAPPRRPRSFGDRLNPVVAGLLRCTRRRSN